MGYVSVKNFEKFQHYRDRNPPWIKLYNELLDDYAFGKMQDASKWLAVGIWLLASRYENKIPNDPEWIKQRINATEKVDLYPLITSGFIRIIKEDSNMLADCKQSAMPETEGERETEDKNHCVFSIHVEDLIKDFPLVNIKAVEKEIGKWKEKHTRKDDIDPRKIVYDILTIEQAKVEKETAFNDCFESLWKDYPERDGDKKKIRDKIRKQITTEQDLSDIRRCLDNYLKHVALKRSGGFPDLKYKNRATWFNNWREWLEWTPAIEPAKPRPKLFSELIAEGKR